MASPDRQLQQPGQGRYYNIGSNLGVTVKEIVDACEKVSGASIDRIIAPRRPGDPAILVASADRLVAELGWQPRYQSIGQIVTSAYNWHNTYPNGYLDKQKTG